MSDLDKGGGGGLQDGDDFDGQGTSSFQNLDSVDTGETNTVHTPPSGTDIYPLLGDNTTVKLRPGGSYTLSGQIDESVATTQLVIKTDGEPGSTSITVDYTGPTGAGSAPINFDDVGQQKVGVRFQGFNLQCNGAEQGYVLYNWKFGSQLKDVSVSNVSGDAIEVSECFYTDMIRPRVDNSNIGGRGMYIHEGEGVVNGLPIYNPQINLYDGSSPSGNQGIDVSGKVTLYSPWVEQTGQQAIRASGPSVVKIINPYIEAYGGDMTTPVGIEFSGRGMLKGGYFLGPGASAKSVHVSSSGFLDAGVIQGGEYIGTADYHIQVETDGWGVYHPLMNSSPETAAIDNPQGYVISGPQNGAINAGWQPTTS